MMTLVHQFSVCATPDEPRQDKTSFFGVSRPGSTQTELYMTCTTTEDAQRLEISDLEIRMIAPIHCIFVANAKSSFSHDEAKILAGCFY